MSAKEPRFYEKGPKRVALIGEVQGMIDVSHDGARAVMKLCLLVAVLALLVGAAALVRTF